MDMDEVGRKIEELTGMPTGMREMGFGNLLGIMERGEMRPVEIYLAPGLPFSIAEFDDIVVVSVPELPGMHEFGLAGIAGVFNGVRSALEALGV